MNLERYKYLKKRTYKEYYFYSEGPKGRILKTARFILVSYLPPTYNLLFGDWNDDEGGYIDDMAISNNGDMEKVLATVAAIIFEFTDIFMNADVQIEGSTPARTRLYQICINKYFSEITETFDLFGDFNGRWEPFKKNTDYTAFKVVRKKGLILQEPTEIYMTKKNNKVQEWIYEDGIDDSPEMVDIYNDPYVLRKMESLSKRVPFAKDIWEKFFPGKEYPTYPNKDYPTNP